MKMTADELKELVDYYHKAQNTPVIALSVADGLAGRDFASQAQARFNEKWVEVCHKYKVDPALTGFNSQTGELV